MLKSTGERQNIDGLNTLVYDVTSIKDLPLYTRVDVEINQRNVMNAPVSPLPSFLQQIKGH